MGMDAAQYTPGPWKVNDHPQNYGDSIETEAGERTVARVEWFGERPTPEAKANARLIAAAPTLLAAAESVEAALRAMAEELGADSCQELDWANDLRAAIIRARGR